MADIKIDSKYLEGIMFNDVKATIVIDKEQSGRKKVGYEKISRKLLASDVLAYKEYAHEVVFVTADGKKYVKPKLGKSGD